MQQAIAAFPNSAAPQFVDLPIPELPGPGEVLSRTLELGVCGTDREILLSRQPWTPLGEPFLALGHECLAEVLAVGRGVTQFQPGDLVVPAVRRPLKGQTRRVDLLPFGAFTERGIVCEHGFSQPRWLDRPEHLYRVPPATASLAVLTEPLAVAEKGFNEALCLQRARLGDAIWSASNPPRVLVTGLGPIAFAAVLAARARNWPVTLAGRDPPETFRAGLVRRLGGEYLSAQNGALELADAPGFGSERDGFDLLLECTGSDAWTLAASAALRSCGVSVWLGSSRTPEPHLLNIERLMRDSLLRNHLHVGCVNAAPRDFHDALDHLAQLDQMYPTELRALITARVRPADALPHYLERQPQGIKAVVVYS
jgi:threonine dehydrogenase-like Zn-dependent dehydrogenase